MNVIFTIALVVLCILVSIQIVYSYTMYSTFNCPECPKCPEYNKQDCIPSNELVRKYIISNFTELIEQEVNEIDFLKNNVIFSNNYIVNYQLDSATFFNKIKNNLVGGKKNFINENLIYVQFTDEIKYNEFIEKYSLGTFPSPLIYFKNSNMLFGKIGDKWKILIDVTKF